jgi:hypothetical protein
MTLAEDRVPRGGTVGDEAFDHISALGTTNFVATVNLYAGIGASPRAPLPRCPMSRRRAFTRSWRGASRSGASGSTHTHRSLRLLGGHRFSRPGARPSVPMGRTGPKAPAGRGRGPGRAARTDHVRRRPRGTRRGERAAGRHARPRAGGERGGGSDKVELGVAGLLVLPEPRPASGRQATA